MPIFWLILAVLAIAVAGFLGARHRALSLAGADRRSLHSLPNYYGWSAAIAAMLPAFAMLALWVVLQPIFLNMRAAPLLEMDAGGAAALAMADVRRVANGLALGLSSGVLTPDQVASITPEEVRSTLGAIGVALGSEVSPQTLAAAEVYRAGQSAGTAAMSVVVLALAVAGAAWIWLRTRPETRARNGVERVMRYALLSAALIAILTTLGIVLSLIFNTVKFFGLYPADEFLFGLTWSPSFGGGSTLGFVPLLWGTLYISFVALIVAVPIGLLAAIYLSEYATSRVRSIAKPALEILAGIPTIVYGLFALVTVGPFLLDIFGAGGVLGVSWMRGATAVMTAGLVMGIMLIPFVSSLSDDIINAVPQAMRDGSYGLGATQSETIRQVILPAALPGIVGAILLAASRAIGETMIVVLGAGAAAQLSMNPFDAMTTVTAKIVSQLTGDADFSSPEALVAFALGMTLFVITLALNVFALWIVRRYREQYE
ncbi:phosphate ABC transporter permease subunit PstC [Wenxinia saemankumensis]|uniref:Phosphate transport system permease protein n=1 Tax=Wenxinia saemankumensis TaxID=1447782 RepID=A0A1M6A600_9RHOB|nr:phosphate ABC transporter permease subunit PstC [Wenxinia saemankumensis]SHI31593.1 phosphate ABC transporter membrane protein 1, PhoT family [Wenxinia saemankumensis]